MKTLKYIRNGKNIEDVYSGKIETFKSITLAKRESWKLQMKNDGALGRGSLMNI